MRGVSSTLDSKLIFLLADLRDELDEAVDVALVLQSLEYPDDVHVFISLRLYRLLDAQSKLLILQD